MPIGLWKIHTKMTHTLTELVFICLYSAVLSLAFNDLFTSSLECTNYTPYERYNTPPPSLDENGVSRGLSRTICRQQIAQVSFIFCSVVFYIAVLVISLLRIFNKVSRRCVLASSVTTRAAQLTALLRQQRPAHLIPPSSFRFYRTCRFLLSLVRRYLPLRLDCSPVPPPVYP